MTLYAKWTQTITINRNGGTAGAITITATYNYPLPSFVASSRANCTLLGYYTSASSNIQVIGSNGTLSTGSYWTNSGAAQTVYAQWSHTVNITNLPNWLGNDSAVLFAWYGSTVNSAAVGEWIKITDYNSSSGTASFTISNLSEISGNSPRFLIVRCINGTTEPSWSAEGTAGTIFNKTPDISLNLSASYSASSWSDYAHTYTITINNYNWGDNFQNGVDIYAWVWGDSSDPASGAGRWLKATSVSGTKGTIVLKFITFYNYNGERFKVYRNKDNSSWGTTSNITVSNYSGSINWS